MYIATCNANMKIKSCWLRETQHCGCNKWVPKCRWLQSTDKGRLPWACEL